MLAMELQKMNEMLYKHISNKNTENDGKKLFWDGSDILNIPLNFFKTMTFG